MKIQIDSEQDYQKRNSEISADAFMFIVLAIFWGLAAGLVYLVVKTWG